MGGTYLRPYASDRQAGQRQTALVFLLAMRLSVGCNWVRHTSGTVVELNACDQIEVNAGDVFVIETPGGGGYGKDEG